MDFLKVPSFGWTGSSDQRFEETFNQIYHNSLQNYYSIMNSLSKCTTLSESTDSQLCFNSNLTSTTTTTTTNATQINENTTFNDISSIETNLINSNKELSIINEQNEPINLCIRDQFKFDLIQYTNKMKMISNILCTNGNHNTDQNNIDYFGMNNSISNNINDNYSYSNNNNNNSFYLTDLTNKMNMNLYTTTNKITPTELKLLPDSLSQFLMMNYNNMHHHLDYNSSTITSTTTTTAIHSDSNNIQGSSMYSIIRTPSPTVQQSHLDNEFLTSTPVWRNKLTDDIEPVEMERDNLKQQQNERETFINEADKMKWRKYSRQINRLYYSRNKITHTQRKIHRKFKNHPDGNNIKKNPTTSEDANDVKESDVITCRTNTRSICRRRRVGWRGTTICAACGLMFEGMNQLNTHYSHIHGSLLESECNFAQYSNSKTSKLLFQAQLDLLISEKELQHNSLTSTMNENNFIPTTSICKENHINISSINSNVNHSISKSMNQFNQQIINNHQIKCYPCPKCNYTAKWPTELQKHVMVHANSRPFICCVCTTSYKWSWDLGRHFTNSHPNLPNPYKRQRINKTILNESRL
uniref:C2H2-type domain-containing protein n=1 Tax=Schistosoma mansoni TaxID=6183 RepID=A0A5K4F708_SCHMA